MAPKPDFAIVYDLDGTGTFKHYGALTKLVDDRALPPTASADLERLRQRYVGPTLAGTAAPEDELKWIHETLDVYVAHRLTDGDWQRALDDVRLRIGFAECVRHFHERGVPQAIISYGVADFVEYVLDAHGVLDHLDQVCAARLIENDDGVVVGYDRDSIVCPENKDEWSRRFAEAHRLRPSRLIAIGDSVGDRRLGCLKKRRAAIARDRAEAERLRPFMGRVFVTETFLPVWDWMLKLEGLVE